VKRRSLDVTAPDRAPLDPIAPPDLADVKGLESAKRALEIAAAGGHPILLTGPSGAGKSMLARRLPGLPPPWTDDEAAVVGEIHQRAGLEAPSRPPFRAPHPCIRPSVLVGGEDPGEVALARGGVLFLDDLPAFGRRSLRALRQPLEEIGRPGPADRQAPPPFLFAAAVRPCPCGHLGDPDHDCNCSPRKLDRHWSAVSDCLLDLIHLHVEVDQVSQSELRVGGECSHQVAERVAAARSRQRERVACGVLNAHLPARALPEVCRPNAAARQLVDDATDRLGLTVRAVEILLRVARTVGDLAGVEEVRLQDVAEALRFRAHVWSGEA
jgi:magnesium chelatase family protein